MKLRKNMCILASEHLPHRGKHAKHWGVLGQFSAVHLLPTGIPAKLRIFSGLRKDTSASLDFMMNPWP